MYNKYTTIYLFLKTSKQKTFNYRLGGILLKKYQPNVFNRFINPYKSAYLIGYKFTSNFFTTKRSFFRNIFTFSKPTEHVKKTRGVFNQYFYIPFSKKHFGLLFKSTKPFSKNQIFYFFYSTVYFFQKTLNWGLSFKFFKNSFFFLNGSFLSTLWVMVSKNDHIATTFNNTNYILSKKKILFFSKNLFFNIYLRHKIFNTRPIKVNFQKKQFYTHILFGQISPYIYFLDKKTNSILVLNNRRGSLQNSNFMNFNFFSLYA